MHKMILRLDFREEVHGKVSQLYIGDINNDKCPEIITCSEISLGKFEVDLRDYNGEKLCNVDTFEKLIISIQCVDFDNDGYKEIILGDDDGNLHIYRFNGIDGFKSIYHKKVLEKRIQCIKNIKYNDQQIVIFGGVEGLLKCYSLADHNIKLVKKIGSPIYAILPVIFQKKLKIVIGCDEELLIYDRETDSFEILKFDNIEERVCDITLIHDTDEAIRILCAMRQSYPIFLDIKSTGFEYPNGICKLEEWDGMSAYSIWVLDTDNPTDIKIIIGGKRVEGKGLLEIHKYNAIEGYASRILSYPFETEVYSVATFEENSDNIFVYHSASDFPLVRYELIKSDKIKQNIIRLGNYISKKPGEYVVFIGAGASFPAFPLADTISYKILQKHCIKSDDIKEL